MRHRGLRRDYDIERAQRVYRARQRGATYSTIGDVLGVTATRARQIYRHYCVVLEHFGHQQRLFGKRGGR